MKPFISSVQMKHLCCGIPDGPTEFFWGCGLSNPWEWFAQEIEN
jgi:hypothetical protein